jgi:uncharacterized repeat protein (TIGR01451 family)
MLEWTPSTPNVTYIPGTGFTGADQFTFAVDSVIGPALPATIVIDVLPVPDLSLSKIASHDQITIGEEKLTYTLTVSNNSHRDATGILLTDLPSMNLELLSISASQGRCTYLPPPLPNSKVTCNLETIVGGGSATVTIVGRPKTIGTILNRATVKPIEGEIDLQNNSAKVSTAVVAPTQQP